MKQHAQWHRRMSEHRRVTSMKWRLHHMGPGCVSPQELIYFLLLCVLFARNASMFIPECNGMFFLTFRRSSEKNWEGRIIRNTVMLFTGKHSCWQVKMNYWPRESSILVRLWIHWIACRRCPGRQHWSSVFMNFILTMICWKIWDNLHSCLFDSVATAGKHQYERLFFSQTSRAV